MPIVSMATRAELSASISDTYIGPILNLFPLWGYATPIFILVITFMIFKISRRKKSSTSSTCQPESVTIRPFVPNILPGNAQHIGTRLEQQDSFAFSDINDREFINQFGVLAILADGMGGLTGGKQASQIAVTTFLHHYLTTPTICSIPEKLVAGVEVANNAILQFARENGLEGGVGTTFIASVVLQNKLYWLSIGDSRIYLQHEEALTQLTTDHIYARELDEKVALGKITKEEAEADPERDSLISFLGMNDLEVLDISHEPVPLEKGDTVILCSDGLYGSVVDAEMIEACRSLTAQEAAEEMIAIALKKQKPNQDNATVALMTII